MDRSSSMSFSAQLRQERIRRNWRQQDLADRLETSAVTVRRWERGSQQPGAYFRMKLCILFGKSPEELGLIAEDVAASSQAENSASQQIDVSSTFWRVPHLRNPYFTGREALLQQLHEHLYVKESVILTQPHIVSGLGGIGKTQTALEYVYRFRHEYQAVLWMNAETMESLRSSYLTLAQLFQLTEKDNADQAVVQEAVARWFQQHHGWLLVFDNVEHLEDLQPFLPDPGQGQILITTRSQMIGTLGFHLDLQNMDSSEGALLLLRRARLLTPEKSIEEVPAVLRSQAEALVMLLDGLPLALDQAGAYIEETRCTIVSYCEHFITSRRTLLSQRGAVSLHHPASVTTTFSLAFAQVEQLSPVAADLLRVCAFLNADAIPEQFFMQAGDTLGPTLHLLATEPLELDTAIRALRQFSLLQRDPATRTLSIHRLLQAIIQDEMPEEERLLWRGRVLRMLTRVFPVEEAYEYIDVENRPWYELIVPHITWITGAAKPDDHPLEVAALLSQLAFYFRDRARFQEAEMNYLRAVALWERSLGIQHQWLIVPLIGLAEVAWFQGKVAQAMSYARRAMTLIEAMPGANHLTLIAPLNILSNIYREQGQYQKAEQLLLWALSIWISTIQAEKLALPPARELASKDAEALIEQALALWSRDPHHRHYSIGRVITALCTVYQKQKRYAEAEALLLRALVLGEEAMGMYHLISIPWTVLADIYKEQGRLEEARRCYDRAFYICEQTLGPEHEMTQRILSEREGAE